MKYLRNIIDDSDRVFKLITVLIIIIFAIGSIYLNIFEKSETFRSKNQKKISEAKNVRYE